MGKHKQAKGGYSRKALVLQNDQSLGVLFSACVDSLPVLKSALIGAVMATKGQGCSETVGEGRRKSAMTLT